MFLFQRTLVGKVLLIAAFFAVSARAQLQIKILTDTATPVLPFKTIVDSVIITSTDQFCWQFQCARGHDKLSNGYSSSDTLPAGTDTILLKIDSIFVGEDCGVRAQLSVSTNTSNFSINLSRQVRRMQSDLLFSSAEKWIPLHATAILDSGNVFFLIQHVGAQGKYDKTQFRIFKWSPLSGEHCGNWIEFSDINKSSFLFQPGAVLWIKTRNASMINLGPGITSSLKDTFTIELPPGFSDFAIPYRFGITIGDIIDATKARGQNINNITFFADTINSSNCQFFTGEIYTSGAPTTTQGLGYVMDGSEGKVYAAYNLSSESVRLSLPPLPTSMSKYSGTVNAAPDQGTVRKNKISSVFLPMPFVPIDDLPLRPCSGVPIVIDSPAITPSSTSPVSDGCNKCGSGTGIAFIPPLCFFCWGRLKRQKSRKN
jgi:hypothetical protein